MPVGAARLLVETLEVLGADMAEQLLQPRVRLQAPQLHIRAGLRRPRGLLRHSGHGVGPRLLENMNVSIVNMAQGGNPAEGTLTPALP